MFLSSILIIFAQNANRGVMRFIYSLVIVLSMLPQLILGATGEERAHFRHFTTREGLVSNRIFSLSQDANGFIWAATDMGMERFDGRNFRHFRLKDYPSMVREDIIFVKCIKDHKVVLSGYNGVLMEYDTRTDKFTDKMPSEFRQSFYKGVEGIYISPRGDRYACTSGGIYRYDNSSGEYISQFPLFRKFEHETVRNMLVDGFGQYWLATVGNLYVCDGQGRDLQGYDAQMCKDRVVTGILPLGGGNMAISAFSDELWIVGSQRGSIHLQRKLRLPFSNVCVMHKDRTGRVWLASDGDGLWYTDDLLSSAHPHFTHLIPQGSIAEDLGKIYALLEDKQGNIWLGTQNNGLWEYDRYRQTNVLFSSDFAFPAASVSSFTSDGNMLWVGTDGQGLYSVRGGHVVRNYKLQSNNLLSLARTSSGQFKVATWGKGILNFDPKTGASSVEQFDGWPQPCNNFFSLSILSNGELWACPANDDLYISRKGKWYRQQLSGPRILPDKWIYKVISGADNSQWVLTANCLWLIKGNRYYPLLRNLMSQKTHTPLDLNDAVVDADGSLIVATNKGVFRFSKNGGKPQLLTFLPKAEYHVLQKDKDGLFWLAGSDGILSFSLKRRSFRYLPGDWSDASKYSFNNRAGYCDAAGNLYFGTNGGYFRFNPHTVQPSNSSIGYFSFSDLYIKRVRVRPGTGVLSDGGLPALESLDIPYDQTDMAISVDVVDYDELSPVQCRYRLVGHGDVWIEMDKNRQISFNSLPKGVYHLEVQAYRPNEKGEMKTISLRIEVLPPWWETWWFRILLCMMLVGGTLEFFRWRLRNLTAMKDELKRLVDARTHQLSEALADKDRLISMVAHDLKNPMFAIVGALTGLNKHQEQMENAERKHVVTEVLASASALQGEMQKLLDWAQSGQTELAWNPTNVNLESATLNVLQLLHTVIEQKQLNLTTDFAAKVYAVADARSVEVVIRNIVNNAIKFTRKGGSIKISVETSDDFVRISVADNGVGMDAEQLANLQASGYHESTQGTANEKGTGLGFTLCQDYMARNNGLLTVNSCAGSGTTVTASFPASSVTIVPQTTQAPESAYVMSAEDMALLAGNTILVVDDDLLICRSLEFMLDNYVSVQVASDGQTALEKTEQTLPDVVLSDVDMPGMNGLELSKALLNTPATCHIPILFISARNGDKDRLLGLQSGAIDYIAKPFSQTELLIKLVNMLRLRQRQQQRVLDSVVNKTTQGAPSEEGGENVDKDPFLSSFKEMVERDFADKQMQLDTMAEKMNVSQSTLSRKIKALTGKSPVDVLTSFRLNRAKQMLETASSEVQIIDIALAVGFNDSSYFTRKFREKFGYTPSKLK